MKGLPLWSGKRLLIDRCCHSAGSHKRLLHVQELLVKLFAADMTHLAIATRYATFTAVRTRGQADVPCQQA